MSHSEAISVLVANIAINVLFIGSVTILSRIVFSCQIMVNPNKTRYPHKYLILKLPIRNQHLGASNLFILNPLHNKASCYSLRDYSISTKPLRECIHNSNNDCPCLSYLVQYISRTNFIDRRGNDRLQRKNLLRLLMWTTRYATSNICTCPALDEELPINFLSSQMACKTHP